MSHGKEKEQSVTRKGEGTECNTERRRNRVSHGKEKEHSVTQKGEGTQCHTERRRNSVTQKG